jgi:hypothetical protein
MDISDFPLNNDEPKDQSCISGSYFNARNEPSNLALKRNSRDECGFGGSSHMSKRRKYHPELGGNKVWQQLGSTVKIDGACVKRNNGSCCRPAVERCFEVHLDSPFGYSSQQTNQISIVDSSGQVSPASLHTTNLPSCSDRVSATTEMDWHSAPTPDIDPTFIALLSLNPVAAITASADTDTAAGGGLRRRGACGSRPRSAYNQHIGRLLCTEAAADGAAAITSSPV